MTFAGRRGVGATFALVLVGEDDYGVGGVEGVGELDFQRVVFFGEFEVGVAGEERGFKGFGVGEFFHGEGAFFGAGEDVEVEFIFGGGDAAPVGDLFEGGGGGGVDGLGVGFHPVADGGEDFLGFIGDFAGGFGSDVEEEVS